MKTNETKTLELGTLCDPISKQLEGILPDKELVFFDLDNEAINCCMIRGYMSDNGAEQARKKLIKKIQKAITLHTTPIKPL